jgi:hypothetical protein
MRLALIVFARNSHSEISNEASMKNSSRSVRRRSPIRQPLAKPYLGEGWSLVILKMRFLIPNFSFFLCS